METVMKKLYKFFISSTYEDLQKERQEVISCVLDSHNFPIAMEQFPASPLNQWDYIKNEIDTTDYYILIVAGKYGTIDPDEQISYTEKEFNYAKEKQIPVIAFMVRDIENLAACKTETELARRDKLNSFRARLLKAGILIKFFDDIKDLKYQVSQSIHQVIENSPRPGWVRGEPQEHSINNIPTATKEDIASLFEGDVSKSGGYIFQNSSRKDSQPYTTEIHEKLSDKAKQILCEVSEDPQGVVIIQKTLAGNNIQTNSKSLMPNGTQREYVEVSDTINDLVKFGLLTKNGEKGVVFQLNTQGYKLADRILKNQRVIKPIDYASLPNIDLSDLDNLTVIIGDTQNGLSTKQIERLFDACDLKDVSPTSGKSNRLYDAFKSKQKSSNSSSSIWKFIEKTLDPIRRNDNADRYKFMHIKINEVLEKYNVYINDEGRFTSLN